MDRFRHNLGPLSPPRLAASRHLSPPPPPARPRSWWWLETREPAGRPDRHARTGEDTADAHLKRTIRGHQVMVPITAGALDLGPWEQIFYAEFDGRRKKRGVIKAMGLH